MAINRGFVFGRIDDFDLGVQGVESEVVGFLLFVDVDERIESFDVVALYLENVFERTDRGIDVA